MSLELVPIIGVPVIVVLAALLGPGLRSRARRRRPDPPPLPEALSADEVAYRIGVVGATRRRIAPLFELLPGPSRATLPSTQAVTPSRPLPAMAAAKSAGSLGGAASSPDDLAASPRSRLIRDTGAALAGLAAIVLLAVAVWPQAPSGGVLGITAPPGGSPDDAGIVALPQPTGPAESMPAAVDDQPSGSPNAPSPAPTSVTPHRDSAGSSAAANPRPRATPRPTSTPRVTPTPVAPPGVTPTPAPSSTPPGAATPTPEPGPTPPPGPDPTPPPMPTPTPTPEPTPTPTPEPTPTPTPEPTPTPTPEPTPTPDATPDPGPMP